MPKRSRLLAIGCESQIGRFVRHSTASRQPYVSVLWPPSLPILGARTCYSAPNPRYHGPGIAANPSMNGGHLHVIADTDDQLDYKLGGSDRFRMKNSGDFDIVGATGNIQVAGADPKRGLYIPASAMYGASTNGAASGQYESATNKINTKVLDFDGATEEYAWVALPSPDWWARSRPPRC